MRMLKNILSKIFYRKNKEEPKNEEDEYLIPEKRIGASITITLDPESADFNVIVAIDDTSDQCAFTLGSLLGMLNKGEMSPYFTQAYHSWCGEDHKKQMFISKVLLNWLESRDSFSSEYENVAVKPSQVFNFPTRE